LLLIFTPSPCPLPSRERENYNILSHQGKSTIFSPIKGRENNVTSLPSRHQGRGETICIYLPFFSRRGKIGVIYLSHQGKGKVQGLKEEKNGVFPQGQRENNSYILLSPWRKRKNSV